MIPRTAAGRLRGLEAADERPESRRRRWLLLLLGLAIWLPSACNALLGTQAFADQVPDRGLLFADPTVDLVPGLVQATALEAAGLMPGDRVTASLDLVNRSAVPVRFAFSAAAEGPEPGLAEALLAVIHQSEDACPPPPATGLPAGPVLYAGPLGSAEFDGLAVEAGPGEVEAASKSRLCVSVELPVGADDRYQATWTRVRLTFDSVPIIRRVGG